MSKKPPIETSIIWCGDNLEKLKHLPDGSVDLIYIDPPFNSNRNYEVFWGETKEKRAFEDRHASTEAYIAFMRPRCVELARVLKTSGSFYYHCDWHASHYVKVMLDQILDDRNFQSEVIWRRNLAKGLSFTGFPNNHDSIFFYGGGGHITFNRPYLKYDMSNLDQKTETKYSLRDPDGRRYQLTSLLNPAHDRPRMVAYFQGGAPSGGPTVQMERISSMRWKALALAADSVRRIGHSLRCGTAARSADARRVAQECVEAVSH